MPSAWEWLGGVLTSDPAIFTDGSDIWVAGAGQDRSLWARTVSGSMPWQSLGGYITSRPTAWSDVVGGYLYVTGADDSVWYRRRFEGTWRSWTPLGGTSASTVAVYDWAAFVVGMNGELYKQKQNRDGAWPGWSSIGGEAISNPAVDDRQVFALDSECLLWAGDIVPLPTPP
jgi:hypothetical protein